MPPPPDGFGYAPGRKSFRQVLTDAVTELSATGYVSQERVAHWIAELRRAAEQDMGPPEFIDRETRAKLDGIFERLVDKGRIAKYVPEVGRFDIAMIRPELRAELDRRIVAAADQIKLRRGKAIEEALARFSGWSTSIPPGGDGLLDKREARADIGKSLAQLKFEKRRCEIDQGHKLISNISEIVALDKGAVAGIWHDHGEHNRSYDARKEHLARSGRLFLVRDSWAIEAGLIRRGSRPYIDEIDRPGQAVYCRCWYQWVVSPRRLPDDVLTARGHEWVAGGRMAA